MGSLIPSPFVPALPFAALVPVLLLLFVPPLAIALAVQTLCFALGWRRLRGRWGAALFSYPLTVLACLALSSPLIVWGPRLLLARELPIAGRMLPVLPAAFVAAAVVVPLVVAWVLRRPRP
ncbi:MAG TPA: hypothetical protein VFR90_13145 [Methylibium sp.]|uniref:hypothetical protein n=1 Tax=Methylibium sp. TaxID=2067992 RepID=UPI002DBEED28|nr:hypothetical protein [Methylibium sp.]HEU4460062.1 hypothetical protein [Methylibium sp.]